MASMKFLEKIQQSYVAIEAMSNLRPKSTGIEGVVIWVSAGEFEGKEGQHGPRVKVILGGGKVTQETLKAAPSVSIKDAKVVWGKLSGKTLKQVQQFIAMNRETLLRYWNQEIDTVEMSKGISKV